MRTLAYNLVCGVIELERPSNVSEVDDGEVVGGEVFEVFLLIGFRAALSTRLPRSVLAVLGWYVVDVGLRRVKSGRLR